MKRGKKILSLVLAATMAFSLCACGKKGDKGGSGSTVSPDKADTDGMQAYMKLYKAGLSAERAAAQI